MIPARRVRVVVIGRVQGVFFRASCAREASSRGLAGWVRNRSDGAVEATFEGDPASVAALVAWCHEGPPGASVFDVDVHDEVVIGDHGFRVTA
jgi:acylphosphatase